ncbi:MAG: hypothetical protein LH470_11200 [Lysobacter sp.]|nr:hypothetical protein [Lysobacter sp.]
MKNNATNLTKNENSGCVMARITRRRQLHSRNFSLTEYGSWPKAEAAAAKWVAGIKSRLPPALASKDRLTSRNESGVVGVALKSSTKHLQSGDYIHYSWQAFWPGNASGVRWGIDKYGDNEAFVHAVLARKLETADRAKVQASFKRIKGTPEYRSILQQKSLELV